MSATPAITPALVASEPATVLQVHAGVPAAVREGSPKAKQAYESARSFEQMLLEQVTQSLVATSGLGGEEGEGEGAGGMQAGEEGSVGQGGGSVLASMLPQVLAEGVMRHGTLGLAGQLTGALDPAAAKPSGAVTGGTSA